MIMYLEEYFIRKYDTFSFDIFDTLIQRKGVKDPRDIFILVAKSVMPDQDPMQFCRDRIEAEKKARNRKLNGEVNLSDIYVELYNRYDAMIKILEEAELGIETDQAQPKENVIRFYNKCISAGKEVFIISDMYIPKYHIITMLEKCGIRYPTRLFISNEYLCNKRNGGLFDVIKKETSIIPQNHIHIGDDIMSDYLMPRKKGMAAFLIHRHYRIHRTINSLFKKYQ